MKETCLPEFLGCRYVASPTSWNGKNYTYVRPYCTTQTGVQYNLYVMCQCETEGVRGKCYGKKECTGNRGRQNNGSTEPCLCAGSQWFDICDDPCNYDGLTANGGYCLATNTSVVSGHYYIKDKCTTSGGEVVRYVGRCKGIDCEGNKGPCYGKTACDNNTIAVDPCTCGGVTYGSSCVIKCPYEQTAADCKAGQTFTQRCKDNSGTWFGECK